jgi:shikimate dehydrogenase
MPDARTALYAVLGRPVEHSLSPAMHNRAFEHAGVNAVYVAFETADIGAALGGMRTLGIRGASITIPHKVTALEFVDRLDEEARQIGALNTVVNRDGKLAGYNTDGRGAVMALGEHLDPAGRAVALIGAGGAARAIGFALKAEGARVTIFNRGEGRGRRLARDLGVDFRPLARFTAARCQVLINTTPVGMTPHTGRTPVDIADLPKSAVVMDIVYNPLETELLRQARRRGCTAIGGVSMFVFQGALQFELWTGRQAPVAVMRRAVMDALKKTT